MLDVKVGDSLFVVFPREKNREGSVDKTYSVVVEKVGRKWIEVSDIFSRVHKESGCLESRVGQAYLTREEWLADQERKNLWNTLHNYFLAPYRYRIPEHLSTEDIKLMLEIINKKEDI